MWINKLLVVLGKIGESLLIQFQGNSTSKSKRYLRWLVEGSSTYYLYAFVAFFLAALISSLI